MRINREKHKTLDATREKVRVFKANEETKSIIVDKNASIGNATVKKAKTRIVSIMVNLVTLFMIALSQR